MTAVSGLTYQSQDQIVADQVTAYGASLGVLPNLQPGDPALALFEATGTQSAWLQFLLQVIWAAARLSTSTQSDVDSFVFDFGMTRLQATFASGPVILAAASAPVVPIYILAGSLIQTPGGAIQYQLVADTTQSAWDASQNAYVLPAGQTSITATAKSLITGSAQNVQAGQLSQFASSVAGVTSVANAAAITNGMDEETDTALKIRFVQFLGSLSEATEAALLFAVNSVQQGLDILPLENTGVSFAPTPGLNTFVINDGSGTAPSTLLNSILTAINQVRAFGIQNAVIASTVVGVNIALTVVPLANPTESNTVIATAVQNGVLAYVNGIELSQNIQTLYINDIVAAAKASDVNVLAVTLGSVTINGVAADFSIGEGKLPRTTLTDVVVTVS